MGRQERHNPTFMEKLGREEYLNMKDFHSVHVILHYGFKPCRSGWKKHLLIEKSFLVNISWVVFPSQDTSDHQLYFLEPFIKELFHPTSPPFVMPFYKGYFPPLITIGLGPIFLVPLRIPPWKKYRSPIKNPRSESVTQASSSRGDPWGETFCSWNGDGLYTFPVCRQGKL